MKLPKRMQRVVDGWFNEPVTKKLKRKKSTDRRSPKTAKTPC